MADDGLKEITVRYFAVFRDLSGQEEEKVITAALTPHALYGELAARYSFPRFGPLTAAVRSAVNDEIVPWDTRLHDRDTVVFLFPVSGG